MLMTMKRLCVVATTALLTVCAAAQGKSPDNGYWKAASKTAQSITGDIVLSGERMTIYFQPFTIANLRELTPEEIAGAFNFDNADGVRGTLYRLNIPADRRFLHKNTMCGNEETQYMATAVQGKMMQVAFFSGAKMPSLKPEDLNNSSALCGTFTYAK